MLALHLLATTRHTSTIPTHPRAAAAMLNFEAVAAVEAVAIRTLLPPRRPPRHLPTATRMTIARHHLATRRRLRSRRLRRRRRRTLRHREHVTIPTTRLLARRATQGCALPCPRPPRKPAHATHSRTSNTTRTHSPLPTPCPPRRRRWVGRYCRARARSRVQARNCRCRPLLQPHRSRPRCPPSPAHHRSATARSSRTRPLALRSHSTTWSFHLLNNNSKVPFPSKIPSSPWSRSCSLARYCEHQALSLSLSCVCVCSRAH